MDPKSESQKRLASWAREMGYLQPDFSCPTPEYFQDACSTKPRRQLWDAIISKLKDRRTVIKDDSEFSEVPIIEKSIDFHRKEANALDAELETQQKKMEDKINRIENIEKMTNDTWQKVLLLRTIRSRNSVRTAQFETVSRNVLESTKVPEEVSYNKANHWMTSVSQEIRSRVGDPELVNDISKRLEEEGWLGDTLWNLFSERHQQLHLELSKTSIVTKELLQQTRSEMPKVGVTWEVILAGQKLDTQSANALSLLMRGKSLLKDAGHGGNPDILSIMAAATGISLRLHKEVESTHEVTDKELEKLEMTSDSVQHRYENLEREVKDVEETYAAAVADCFRMRIALDDARTAIKWRLRHEAEEWRKQLQRRLSLIKEHNQLIEHQPLSLIRLGSTSSVLPPVVEDRTIEIPLATTIYKTDDNIYRPIADLVQALKIQESKQDKRWKKCNLQLRKNQDRLKTILKQTEEIAQLFKACQQQPFADMIPASITVNGMSLKDWTLQLEVISNIPSGSDFSTSIYPTDL